MNVLTFLDSVSSSTTAMVKIVRSLEVAKQALHEFYLISWYIFNQPKSLNKIHIKT